MKIKKKKKDEEDFFKFTLRNSLISTLNKKLKEEDQNESYFVQTLIQH